MAVQHPLPPPIIHPINHTLKASLLSQREPAALKRFTSYPFRFSPHLSRRFASSLCHLPFLLILLLHLALSLTYASQVPLGEAPDEPAHLAYAQFIARHGRLPATLAERQTAGYRSAWPPLYHFMVAGPLALIGDAPPARLKAVGDTPRRLIPTDGQTIAAFIHTADEAPPWRGLPLAWHLGRLISVALTAFAVVLTYVIARRLTGQPYLALCAAALHAFIPQLLFIGSVLNDDNLLICLSGLIFLLLISYPAQSQPRHAFFLGALLGLATVAKYNALPLWAVVIVWSINRAWQGWKRAKAEPHAFPSRLPRAALAAVLLPFFSGALLTAGWWFGFIWFHFNQVDQAGLLPGSLAALNAGASDASLRQLSTGGSHTFPPAAAWPDWLITLFETFWGSFGGGSTIDLPTWAYWLLAFICLLAIMAGVRSYASESKAPGGRITLSPPRSSLPTSLFLLSPLFFLPLPLLRFILSGSIIETAQGRHLFPALPAIALGLVWGLSRSAQLISHFPYPPLRFIPLVLPVFTFSLSLYALSLITAGYPPPIPLHTTADAASNPFRQVEMAEGVSLVGYEVGQVESGYLPLSLVWQADAVPPDDYLIELTLTDKTNQVAGSWLGHPLGGRYPTRAWDKGDVLRHTLPIPLLPNLPATPLSLTLRLLDSFNQPTSPTPITLFTDLSLTSTPPLGISHSPTHLRADELPPDASFTYRSTLSFVLPGSTPPKLIAPTGQSFAPNQFITGPHGSIAHFIVAANWPSGAYQLTPQAPSIGARLPVETYFVSNRLRQFTPPTMQHTLNANFAGALTLLGYDLPQRRVQPGQSFPITLHWRAERSLGQNLIVFNHLLDQAAIQRGGADRVPQRHYSTLLWVPGEIVSDAYNVPVAANAPAGVYWLDAGLYPSDLPTFSLPLLENGQPIDRNSVRLGPIKVGGPPPGITLAEANPQHPLNITFDNQITLLGFDLREINNHPEFTPQGAGQTLKLYWRADSFSTTDYTVFVHLLDPAGKLVAQFDSPPAAGAYPTSLWDPGEIIADEHLLANLPPNRYILQIGLYRPDTGERLPVAGLPDGAVKLAEFEIEE